MEGLKVSDAILVVFLHPSKSKRVSKAVLRELSSHLFQFSEIFDGVLLAYDVDIVDRNATILSGIHPYIGVRLKAKLLLFSPKPNMLLEGKVVKLTPESIHVIVLGFASAVIIDEDVREEFEYRTKHGKEVYRSKAHRRHIIEVGTMIRFLVKRSINGVSTHIRSYYQLKGRDVWTVRFTFEHFYCDQLFRCVDEEILHICGSLKPSNTGSIHWLDKNFEELSLLDRSGTKRESEKEMKMQEHAVVGGEEISLGNDQIKKSKKRRLREES